MTRSISLFHRPTKTARLLVAKMNWQDVIQSFEHKFPLGKALATLIRQQGQVRSKSQKKKPKKPKKR
jgi:hypothetical protein